MPNQRQSLRTQLRRKLRALGHEPFGERLGKVTARKKDGRHYMTVEYDCHFVGLAIGGLEYRGTEVRTPRNITEAATMLLLVM